MTISFLFGAAVLACLLIVVALGRLTVGPYTWRRSPTDILILAAHQDDCVIMGAEYALWVLQARKKVKIVYLTSGSANDTEVAATRAAEAVAAWRLAGVAQNDLHFLDYRQSDVDGDCAITPQELSVAAARIEELIRGLPRGSAVLVPAAGESHVDHRELRRISLTALGKAGRADLLTLESPEYNPFLSWIRCPKKVLQYVLKCTPFMWRYADAIKSPFPGFPNGLRSFQLLTTPAVYHTRREMLGCFISQDPILLFKYFDWRTQFRPLGRTARLYYRSPRLYLRIGRRYIGATVILMWASVNAFGLAASWGLIRVLDDVSERVALAVAAMLLFVLGLAMWRNGKQVERQVTYAACALGVLAACSEYFVRARG